MLARPRRGDGYQQEYHAGEAEDRATVLSLDGSLQTWRRDSCDGLLVTEETTPLEPGLVEQKYYAPAPAWSSRRRWPGATGRRSWSGSPPARTAR